MLTAIVQLAIWGTIALSFWIIWRERRLNHAAAVAQGKRDEEQAAAACKARARGEEAVRIGSEMLERNLRPAPGGRWSSTERNSLRGVPPRLDYVRTPAEDLAVKAGIILSTSISMAECRERQRIQGSN